MSIEFRLIVMFLFGALVILASEDEDEDDRR